MKPEVDCHLLHDSSFQNDQEWKKNKLIHKIWGDENACEFETWARSGCEMKKGSDKLSSDFINLKMVWLKQWWYDENDKKNRVNNLRSSFINHSKKKSYLAFSESPHKAITWFLFSMDFIYYIYYYLFYLLFLFILVLWMMKAKMIKHTLFSSYHSSNHKKLDCSPFHFTSIFIL